jgi:hypothetical protein
MVLCLEQPPLAGVETRNNLTILAEQFDKKGRARPLQSQLVLRQDVLRPIEPNHGNGLKHGLKRIAKIPKMLRPRIERLVGRNGSPDYDLRPVFGVARDGVKMQDQLAHSQQEKIDPGIHADR